MLVAGGNRVLQCILNQRNRKDIMRGLKNVCMHYYSESKLVILNLKCFLFVMNSHTYKLYAVIEHLGGPHSGHYCTYRRHGNHWIYTSDTLVYPVSTKEVMKCQAYMLFYQRISNCFNFGTDNS